MRVKAKKTICYFCTNEESCKIEDFCEHKKFRPTAETFPNYPNGSQAKWRYAWYFTRKLVYLRDKRTCYFCKKKILDKGFDVHHLKRRDMHGSNHPRNLVLACVKCHKITLASATEKALITETTRKKYTSFWKNQGIVKP